MKILIIEDDLSFQEILRKALEQERYLVEIAPDYRTGLCKITDYTYDCILLDINLPDGNGLNLLRQLKEMKRTGGLIIISARDTIEDKVEGLDLGADDYNLEWNWGFYEIYRRSKRFIYSSRGLLFGTLY